MSTTTGGAATASATTTDQSATPSTTDQHGSGSAQLSSGMTLYAFVTALTVSLVVFSIQMGAFFLLRNKLARILCVALCVALSFLSSNVSHAVNPRRS